MRRLSTTVFKRTLDVLIVLYLILIPIIAITGGFKISVLGIPIKATHLYTPLQYIIPLILIRLIITIEFKNFLLIITSVFVGFIIMEVAVRMLDPIIAKPEMIQLYQKSPVLGWDLIPGSSGIGVLDESYEINAAGFRDFEYALRKREGMYRIMVIGDSFTFGRGVDLKDTYPKQLERILNAKNLSYEVINCGIIGHDMWQHYAMLKHKVLPYRPDLVVLGLHLNDFTQSYPPNDPQYQGSNPIAEIYESEVLRWSYFWNTVRHINSRFEYKYRYRRGYTYLKSIEKRKERLGPARSTDVSYRIMSGKMEKRKYLEFSKTLKEFVRAANLGGSKVLVVMIPDSVQLNDPELQFVNDFVSQMTGKLGVPFVDTTRSLEAEEDHTSLYLFPFDAHNSPKGLKIIAEAIADKIGELGLLQHADSQSSINASGS